MTSLEGVPRMAVVGTDLHAGVTGGSRGLPLLALANDANGTAYDRPRQVIRERGGAFG